MENPFKNNELCDGGCCVVRSECARYMDNVDLDKANPYVVFNRKPWPAFCPHYLPVPDSNYPAKNGAGN